MYQKIINAINKEDKEAVDILVREIMKAIKGKTINRDRTYKTVIKRVTRKGYVIQDEAGCERTVPCYVPNVTLQAGQSVYVKEPLGNLNELHICSVIENTNNSRRR